MGERIETESKPKSNCRHFSDRWIRQFFLRNPEETTLAEVWLSIPWSTLEFTVGVTFCGSETAQTLVFFSIGRDQHKEVTYYLSSNKRLSSLFYNVLFLIFVIWDNQHGKYTVLSEGFILMYVAASCSKADFILLEKYQIQNCTIYEARLKIIFFYWICKTS